MIANGSDDWGNKMDGLMVYFSDFFGIDETVVTNYGAVNVKRATLCYGIYP